MSTLLPSLGKGTVIISSSEAVMLVLCFSISAFLHLHRNVTSFIKSCYFLYRTNLSLWLVYYCCEKFWLVISWIPTAVYSIFHPLPCYLISKLHKILATILLFLEAYWFLATSLWQLLLNVHSLPSVEQKSVFLILMLKYYLSHNLYVRQKYIPCNLIQLCVQSLTMDALSNLWKLSHSCFQHYSTWPYKISTVLCNCWNLSRACVTCCGIWATDNLKKLSLRVFNYAIRICFGKVDWFLCLQSM